MKTRLAISALAVLGLMLSGCGKDKKDSNKAPAKKPLAELINAEKPGLAGPLGQVKWGDSVEDVRKKLPWIGEEGDDYSNSVVYHGELEGYDETIEVGFEFGNLTGLTEIRVPLPKDTATKLLEGWGEAELVKMGYAEKASPLYFGEGVRVEAVTREYEKEVVQLKFTTITTYDQVVGKDGLLKPAEMLGKTPAELVKAYPKYIALARESTDKADVDCFLPPTKYQDGRTLVHVHFNDAGKVRSYSLDVEFRGKPAAKEAVLAAAKKAWGESKDVKFLMGKQATWYDEAAGIRASAEAKDDEVDLSITSYQSLAKLLGDDKAKLGFETAPILGATLDELKKSYPTLVIENDGKDGYLEEEKTDYESSVGTTRVHLDLKDGKVTRFWFNLEWDKADGVKAEIEGLLKKKYGEPTPLKDDFSKRMQYNDAPKVLVKSSDITKDITIEVVSE